MLKLLGLLAAATLSLSASAAWADLAPLNPACDHGKADGDACELKDQLGKSVAGICAPVLKGDPQGICPGSDKNCLACVTTTCDENVSQYDCCEDGHVGACYGCVGGSAGCKGIKCTANSPNPPACAAPSTANGSSSSGGCALEAVGAQGPLALGMLGIGLGALLLQRRKQAGKR